MTNSAASLLRDVQPALPVWSSQIIRQMRSVSPRSMTCKGVEPSNAGFGCFSHSPMALESTMSDNVSKSRVNSMRRFCAEPPGVRPPAQCATARGENPANRVKDSCVTPNESQNLRTENSPLVLCVTNTIFRRLGGRAPFVRTVFEAASRVACCLATSVFILGVSAIRDVSASNIACTCACSIGSSKSSTRVPPAPAVGSSVGDSGERPQGSSPPARERTAQESPPATHRTALAQAPVQESPGPAH